MFQGAKEAVHSKKEYQLDLSGRPGYKLETKVKKVSQASNTQKRAVSGRPEGQPPDNKTLLTDTQLLGTRIREAYCGQPPEQSAKANKLKTSNSQMPDTHTAGVSTSKRPAKACHLKQVHF
ncbi:hypothetical protein DPX16_22623 [Anabarilius grahami]|uniref:Uncharacterized protein n=1 Tax=Anabarilius grahami TaxID=495550 RepID=A0A3N0XH00_ANAGA|nr:hypothetical protein DPX16_22623 [Anabarilius grahami]